MSWICPYCHVAAILKDGDFSKHEMDLAYGNEDMLFTFSGVTCPNPECGKAVITMATSKYIQMGATVYPSQRSVTNILPSSTKSRAKDYPAYIPAAILEDYQEACAIVDLSPKASATLARRALQGMIRDFWDIKENNLSKAIKALEEKITTDEWEAIDGIRKIGNIGAHMESDINTIVEVNPEEGLVLIEMIEMFLDEWYVARYDREQRLKKMKSLAHEKQAARKSLNQ